MAKLSKSDLDSLKILRFVLKHFAANGPPSLSDIHVGCLGLNRVTPTVYKMRENGLLEINSGGLIVSEKGKEVLRFWEANQ